MKITFPLLFLRCGMAALVMVAGEVTFKLKTRFKSDMFKSVSFCLTPFVPATLTTVSKPA